MDNRVIGISILVAGVVLYVTKIPQKLYALVKGGGADTLSSVLSSTQPLSFSSPSDASVYSPGAVTNSTSTGPLPGNVSVPANSTGSSSAATVINQHQLALSNPGVDPMLDDLVARLPATNNPQQGTWIAGFRTCYGAGGDVASCAAQTTSNLGFSPFG